MDVHHSLQFLLQFLVDAASGDMHHFLFDCHQGVDRHPGIAENGKLFNSVTHQNAARPHIDENYPGQTLLLRPPTQQRSPELAPPRQFYKHVLAHEDLFEL